MGVSSTAEAAPPQEDPREQRMAGLLETSKRAWERDDYTTARDSLRELAAMLCETPQGKMPLLASCLSDLGEAVGLLGDHAAARNHLDAALALQRQLPFDAANLTRTLFRLGRTQLALGGNEDAITQLGAAAQLLLQASGGAPHPALGFIKRDMGAAYAKLGRHAEALGSYEQALVLRRAALRTDLNIEIANLLSNIGEVLYALGQGAEARDRFERALGVIRALQAPDRPNLRRDLATALNNVGAIARKLDDDEAAVRYLEEALEIDPELVLAAYNLFSVRSKQGNRPEMLRLAEMAYRRQSYVEEPTLGADRTLMLILAIDGNIPHDNLVARRSLNKLKWFIEYSNPSHEAKMPRYDAVLSIVGDPDEGAEAIVAATEFHARCPAPFLNDPARLPATRRDRLPELLAGIDGLVLAPVRRMRGDTLRGPGRDAVLAEAGLALPLLVRALGKHGGDSVQRVDTEAALDEACARLEPDSATYITAFRDYASADGHYRKYRTIFVDREPYPYHLAISQNWMVHYFSADMEAHPWKLAEERRFLEDTEAVLGPRAMATLAEVARRLDLDYGGADFTLLPDGRVFLFEANATMLVHGEAADGPLAHKNAAVGRIFAAFDTMLDRACGIARVAAI